MKEQPTTEVEEEDMEDDDNFGEKNGFFKTYHLAVLRKLDRDHLMALSTCRSDEERLECIRGLSYVHQLPEAMSSALSNLLPNGKSAVEAQQKRMQGNDAFKMKDYSRAVQLYTEAVMKAPSIIGDGSVEPELALAFANRSAALVHLADYTKALTDIDQALNNGYPAELRYKLAERQAKCMMALGKPTDEVAKACELAIKYVGESRLDQIKRNQFERDIKQLMDESRSLTVQLPEYATQSIGEKKKKKLPEVAGGKSIEHPSLSSKIRIESDPNMGRYGVADSAFRVGDILAVDAPFASVMNPLKFPTNCHHCYLPLDLGESLPCPKCCDISFCSASCRTQALESYHAIECPILDCLYAAGISITCYLALRMMALHPISFYLEARRVIEQPELQADVDDKMKKYLQTYNLVTHSEKRNKESFFHVTLMANFLLKCLKVANYFGDAPPSSGLNFSDPLTDQERWIGSLLLRHIQLLQFNAHEISELRMKRPGCMDGARALFLGAAVYPTVSLFNHSCEPSVVRYCINDVMVVRAIKTIAEGDMINENYGPIFTQKRRETRQKILRERYWFDCRCLPCVEEWPLIDAMTDNALRFRCTERRCRKPLVVPVDTMTPFITCPSCKKSNNILKSLQSLQDTEASFLRGSELMNQGDFAGALECCIQTLTKLDEILCPPYRDYVQCQEGARRCFLTQGNVVYKP